MVQWENQHIEGEPMDKEYTFQIDLALDQRITEAQKNQLMVQLGNVVKEVLGPAKSGAMFIHTPAFPESIRKLLSA
jgi:hypothetical protein